MVEFLIETLTISFLGSAIGTAIGLGVAIVGCSMVDVEIIINPQLILTCVVFSVGLVYCLGYIQRKKAASLKPVDTAATNNSYNNSYGERGEFKIFIISLNKI